LNIQRSPLYAMIFFWFWVNPDRLRTIDPYD
jgi:hypothetical protein